MTAIIVLSHGSRHPQAAPVIAELAAQVGELTGLDTVAAHLELSAPSLVKAAAGLRRAGHYRAVVVPLLFAPGYHLLRDAPAQIQAAQEASGLELVPAGPLGAGADIAELLAARVRDRRAHLVIYAVGSSQPQADTHVECLAVRLADLTGQSTSVAFATRGGAATLTAQRALYPRVEVLALFVAPGLLLDGIAKPLGAELAPIVAARSRAALPVLVPALNEVGA